MCRIMATEGVVVDTAEEVEAMAVAGMEEVAAEAIITESFVN